jgi:ubiquinone/menaquinone biosynthesis C-methylase UbiE
MGTQKYFDSVPTEWDAFYAHENKFKYAFNNIFRKGLYERYRLAFEHCGDLSGATVLDIGCGTGRYSIESVKRGAKRVVGIDFAPAMIEFSQKIAQEMKVADRCEFICDDFLTHSFNDSFDIVFALGFFDYIRDAGPIFEKITKLHPRKFVASFPKFTPIWGMQRKVRYYWIKKCPIYNFTVEQLKNLYNDAQFEHHQILPCGKGFFGVAGTK